MGLSRPEIVGSTYFGDCYGEQGRSNYPRWAFGLAAAVVALLVVLVIVLIPRGGDNSNTSASGGSNGAAQSKATSTVAAGTCGAGASDDQAVLDAAPKDTTWVTTDGVGWVRYRRPQAR